jgi:hypothetical protein
VTGRLHIGRCAKLAFKPSAVALLLGVAVDVSAAQAVLKGRVTDSAGTLIADASVSVVGAYWQTKTRSDGSFELRVPAETWLIRFRRIGFAPDSVSVTLPTDPITIQLATRSLELKAVSIVADRTPAMAQTVTISTVRQVPPLGEPDIFRAIVLLPGVSEPNDLKGRIHLAGGPSDETGVRLDGHPLQDPFHLLGVLGAFNVAALERADVMIHHVPIESDNRLSGVISLESRRSAVPVTEGVLGLLSSGATTVRPEMLGGVTLLASGRVTYLDKIIRLLSPRATFGGDELTLLGYHDFLLRADKAWNQGSVEAINFSTEDARGSSGSHRPYIWGETLWGVKAERAAGNWHFDARASLNRAAADLPPDERTLQQIRLRSDWTSAEVRVSHVSQDWMTTLGFGLDARRTEQSWADLQEGFFSPHAGPQFAGGQRQTLPALFGEISKSLTASLRATAGAHMTRSSGQTFISPRGLLEWSFAGNHQLAFSLERRHQFDTELEEPSEGSGRQPLFLLARPRIADVAAISLANPPKTASDWQLVAFAKRYKDRTSLTGEHHNEPISDTSTFPQFERIPGYSVGVTMTMTHRLGARSLVQTAYTYQRTREKIGGVYSPTDWDAPHALNVFVTAPISTHWSLNVASQWHSGAAITPPIERVLAPDPRLPLEPSLSNRFIFGSRNSARLPAYRRTDIGLRKEWKKGKADLAFSVQAINVLAHTNPLAIDPLSFFCGPTSRCTVAEPSRSGLPILPSIGFEIKW